MVHKEVAAEAEERWRGRSWGRWGRRRRRGPTGHFDGRYLIVLTTEEGHITTVGAAVNKSSVIASFEAASRENAARRDYIIEVSSFEKVEIEVTGIKSDTVSSKTFILEANHNTRCGWGRRWGSWSWRRRRGRKRPGRNRWNTGSSTLLETTVACKFHIRMLVSERKWTMIETHIGNLRKSWDTSKRRQSKV